MNQASRVRRHLKIRRKVTGTKMCPRLAVFRSSQHIIAQMIDDSEGKTLGYVSDFKEKGTKLQKAYNVGKNISLAAAKLKIKTVVFDRGGFLYQGRVAEVAKGAREGGLKF